MWVILVINILKIVLLTLYDDSTVIRTQFLHIFSIRSSQLSADTNDNVSQNLGEKTQGEMPSDMTEKFGKEMPADMAEKIGKNVLRCRQSTIPPHRLISLYCQ